MINFISIQGKKERKERINLKLVLLSFNVVQNWKSKKNDEKNPNCRCLLRKGQNTKSAFSPKFYADK